MKGKDMREKILQKARELGASLAGIAGAAELQRSPSHEIFGKLGKYTGVGAKPDHPASGGPFEWPADARSVLVIALAHPEDRPGLDWWRKDLPGGTAGNRTLMALSRALAQWLQLSLQIPARGLPYHTEEGGVFLKDAAVLAGLGCIGLNNLLVTPSLGPRIRLRAMFLDRDLPATGPSEYDPCRGCPKPCQSACPRQAFAARIYDETRYGLSRLPARDGGFSRERCNEQMEADIRDAELAAAKTGTRTVHYCRACEWACPAGRERA